MVAGGSSLVIPVVMWGRHPPTHCISAIMMTSDMQNIVTGCNDGQLIIWDVSLEWQINPKNILFGHTASICCLTRGSNSADKSYVVSAAENGELCLWDLKDGRCIENSRSNYVHTNIQSHQFRGARHLQLVCSGFYPEIHVLDALSFEPMFSLCSKVAPDWISACCVINPVNRDEDVVMAISNSGAVKVWILSETEVKNRLIFEDESKQIRCLNAQTFTSCPYNQRTVLVVCTKYWQIYCFDVHRAISSQYDPIYDASDFVLLCSESNRCGERWVGGSFISIDRIVVWSNEGKGYLYKLPTNAIPDTAEYHTHGQASAPHSYQVLDAYSPQPFSCTPAMSYHLGIRDNATRILLRGDCDANVAVWKIPDIADKQLKLVRQESFDRLPVMSPTATASLVDSWNYQSCTPRGILDDICDVDGVCVDITATIYIPSQGKLCCGRDDGSIVILPATHSVILQLLHKKNVRPTDIPVHTLSGHNGKVTCLLYPFTESTRYEPQHLLSGGIDFSVCLWDIYTGEKLLVFCVHGGEVTQLLVPPSNCNPRILSCICSVASDHSVTLLSLKEKKCVMLAGRHLFPVSTIKWRPLDDFMVVGCTDGTVYVWQMETGHLDRVVQGITAEEILNNCDENATPMESLVNPTISLTQALKRRNLATFRNLAQQKLQVPNQDATQPRLRMELFKPNSYPLYLQGVRANTKNSDSHILFFDMESLIVQLVGDEYALKTPGELESQGQVSVADRSQKHMMGDMRQSQMKIAGFVSSAKSRGESSQPPAAENVSFVPIQPAEQTIRRVSADKTPLKPRPTNLDMSGFDLTMETAQILMSCLHAWGLDPDLDKLCVSKLGLLTPRRPICFGLVSRQGYMSLMLPGWQRLVSPNTTRTEDVAETTKTVSFNDARLDTGESNFTKVAESTRNGGGGTGREEVERRGDWLVEMHSRWLMSNAISTQHLLSVISLANTLMTMNHATFLQTWRLHKQSKTDGATEREQDPINTHQSQVKQGWSLLAALHCVLLPDIVGAGKYKAPLLEMLARRWQDRCLEIREAGQALLLAELRRIGPEGRKAIVDSWSPYLPTYVDPHLSLMGEKGDTEDEDPGMDDDEAFMLVGDSPVHRSSQSYESRRRQATAIVMLGVIGAEFGQEIQPSKHKADNEKQKKTSVQEGFGLSNYSLARHTSKALTFLLLQPPSKRLPAFSPIRRAGIDLIGRGFTVWEPYLDVSAVLLGLLELCTHADRLVPSQTYGLPLSPEADACRTARHALSLIATARPSAFIITMAKEVARHNALALNAQTPAVVLNNSVLVRGKGEIQRVIELLVDKLPNDVVELMVEAMDVTVHCLDVHAVKNKGLQDIFPNICKFSVVTSCNQTRRICVGARNGGLAFYEPKQNSKCQMLQAHQGIVVAVSFSPDGKYLASYSNADNRLKFWQTGATSLFNIGHQQTKCVKSVPTAPFVPSPHINILKLARLVWIDGRTIILLTIDGTESKYSI